MVTFSGVLVHFGGFLSFMVFPLVVADGLFLCAAVLWHLVGRILSSLDWPRRSSSKVYEVSLASELPGTAISPSDVSELSDTVEWSGNGQARPWFRSYCVDLFSC